MKFIYQNSILFMVIRNDASSNYSFVPSYLNETDDRRP